MVVNIVDYKKRETRKADTNALTMLQWVKVNFGGWGFYEIIKSKNNHYNIYDKFSKQLEYEITRG